MTRWFSCGFKLSVIFMGLFQSLRFLDEPLLRIVLSLVNLL
jgi:hypothetical protein